MSIDLVWMSLTEPAPQWNLGDIHTIRLALQDVTDFCRVHLPETTATMWLFWDPILGDPDPEVIQHTSELSGHLWHAGLKLGSAGLPHIINHVFPLWMLNADPAPDIRATSWRVSLRACLITTDALRHLGGISSEYQTLTAASLDLGYRAIRAGLLPLHVPQLTSQAASVQPGDLTFADEFVFARKHFAKWQLGWSCIRTLMTRRVGLRKVMLAWQQSKTIPPFRKQVKQFPHPQFGEAELTEVTTPHITVLIPTIDRYPYLRTILSQLRDQTLIPHQVIVVDQTPIEARDIAIATEFSDLPLTVLYLDKAGQCESRNLGLAHTTGDYVMFLDDDVEIPETLLEHHYQLLRCFGVVSTSGTVYEPPLTPQNVSREVVRHSDVFPMGITMLRREALHKSGLFDLAFNQRSRADHDLGMRIYLSGGQMLLDERFPVLHHRAPRGGLRTHNARVITSAKRRASLTTRKVVGVSDIYIGLRYYSRSQVQEALWINLLSNFSGHGGTLFRIEKFIIASITLPMTLWEMRRNYGAAVRLTSAYPKIPLLDS